VPTRGGCCLPRHIRPWTRMSASSEPARPKSRDIRGIGSGSKIVRELSSPVITGLPALATRQAVKPSAQPTLVRTQHPPRENCLVLIDDSRRRGPDRLSQRRRFVEPLVGIHRSLAAACLSPSSGSNGGDRYGECAAACRKRSFRDGHGIYAGSIVTVVGVAQYCRVGSADDDLRVRGDRPGARAGCVDGLR
jgi:hypothetical protein